MDWLPWQDGLEMAGASAGVWATTARWERHAMGGLSTPGPGGAAGRIRPWAKELTVLFGLYSLWQYAGQWSIGRRNQALTRGEWIWRAERSLGAPSEREAQSLIIHLRAVEWVLNGYYAWVHVTALGLCLVWLFVRHRSDYPRVRTALALITGSSLLIQLWPVAPPRLLPQTGVVDTGALVGPSVYARGAPGIDQLSAMPSLHVGWALAVGLAVFWAGRGWDHGWLRWLGWLYPALTTLVVVVTGNHYWADAGAELVLFAAAVALVCSLYRPAMGDSHLTTGNGVASVRPVAASTITT